MIGVPVPGMTSSLPAGPGTSAPHLAESNSRVAMRAAIYAGMIAAALSLIPLGPSFVLALPFAGFLSVLFYRRWARGPELPPGSGFRLGALAGVFGFVGFLVLTAVGTLTSHGQHELREALLESVRQQQARAADPQVRQMLDYLTTPPGIALMILAGFLVMAAVFILLSGAGALLSASLLDRKDPPNE
jgi:drug/metabolite transporter (DMT)-like permease